MDRRGDRDSLGLPGRQIELVEAIALTGTPTVAVVMGGRPLDLGPLVEACGAVLQVWYPGQEGGTAVAEILAGDVAPTGHLPITMPPSVGQLPMHSGLHASSHRRYLFTDTGPRFPFGHGLTYTTFSVSTPDVEPVQIESGHNVVARARVTNTGPRRGATVVQCYVTDRVASVARPALRLVGFTRVELDRDQATTVEFRLGTEALAIVGRDGIERIEPGDFDIHIGLDAETTNSATLTVR